jgi:hypothetical protein
MPEPERKSDLPVGCVAPLNLEEAALKIEVMLASGSEEIFKPIPTGFVHYDRLLGGGLHSGDLHIIGGVQNIGKTAKVLQMAGYIAAQDVLALVVCYEHSVMTLWERLLCQCSFAAGGDGFVTADALRTAYILSIRNRDIVGNANGDMCHMLDEVIRRLPEGLKAWNRLSKIAQNIWLVTGDGLFTTIDALEHYLHLAFSYRNRVVLFIDYLQQLPVLDTERHLEAEERIERALKGLKALALRSTNAGKVLPVVAVAAVDEEGLRKGRVHVENLWGNAVIQYEPDVVWIGNRDGKTTEGNPIVRWGVEKNRRGPSDLEFRHAYEGAAYSFKLVGEPVSEEESWQSERVRVDHPTLTPERR